MNWTTIRSTLKTAIEGVDGLSHAGAVEWGDSAQASVMRPMPRIDLTIRSLRGIGDDEPRTGYDEDTDTMETALCGHRQFTVSIRVESDKATGGEAMTIADRLRVRLGRENVTQALRTGGLAIADIAATQVLDFKTDGRALVVAVLDVIVNAAENDVDDHERAGDFIEHVVGASEYLTNPDGEENANQVDLDVSA